MRKVYMVQDLQCMPAAYPFRKVLDLNRISPIGAKI